MAEDLLRQDTTSTMLNKVWVSMAQAYFDLQHNQPSQAVTRLEAAAFSTTAAPPPLPWNTHSRISDWGALLPCRETRRRPSPPTRTSSPRGKTRTLRSPS